MKKYWRSHQKVTFQSPIFQWFRTNSPDLKTSRSYKTWLDVFWSVLWGSIAASTSHFDAVLKVRSEFPQLSPYVRWLIWLVEQLDVCKPNILLVDIKPEAVLLLCIKCTSTPKRPKGLNQWWRSFGQRQSTARGMDQIWSEVKALYHLV